MGIGILALLRTIRTQGFLLLSRRPGRRIAVGTEFVLGGPLMCSRGVIFTVGNRVYIGYGCHVGVDVRIGDDVLVASQVSFVGGDHVVDDIDVPMRRSGRATRFPVGIGNNVWIGHGAIILHGVSIGDGAVVAAGAVVTQSVCENEIVGGNPARRIRLRRMPT